MSCPAVAACRPIDCGNRHHWILFFIATTRVHDSCTRSTKAMYSQYKSHVLAVQSPCTVARRAWWSWQSTRKRRIVTLIDGGQTGWKCTFLYAKPAYKSTKRTGFYKRKFSFFGFLMAVTQSFSNFAAKRKLIQVSQVLTSGVNGSYRELVVFDHRS